MEIESLGTRKMWRKTMLWKRRYSVLLKRIVEQESETMSVIAQ